MIWIMEAQPLWRGLLTLLQTTLILLAGLHSYRGRKVAALECLGWAILMTVALRDTAVAGTHPDHQNYDAPEAIERLA
ncbi:MAG: hypothetical protein CML02_02340 [Pseudooceanicola sp.]|nr:hypothetical protein [Pseudooceanicola sp.]|tara:strand:+ start:1197 stop:1430 length:234 start_codon:yes stop_codon:yes gene_type:complete